MRKWLLLASAGLSAFPADAQTLSSPPDVGTYVPVAATYASGTTPNVLGDNSNAKGGTAPAFSTFPPITDPNPTPTAGYVVAGAGAGCALASPVVIGCQEKKARFEANATAFRYDDPIRYWGQPGVSHCHEFFGNTRPSARSTRLSVRTFANSWAGGGPANGTVYWEPCTIKLFTGKKYAIPAMFNVIYYSVGVTAGTTLTDRLQPLHEKFRFIGGRNMDDPDDAAAKAEIATANAQSGTAGRYQYMGNGISGYSCITSKGTGTTVTVVNGPDAGQTFSRSYITSTGTDPWGGNCTDGSAIVSTVDAPPCWDGVNVSSPTGYGHVRYRVLDTVTGLGVCPNGWYEVPVFEGRSFHITRGPADYMTWTLASDAMMSAKLTALGTPRTVLAGESLHFDWLNGWNPTVLSSWLGYCLGIGTNTPHTCDTNDIDATHKLLADGNSPDGKRVPQVDLTTSVDSNDKTVLFQVETSRQSTHTMKSM